MSNFYISVFTAVLDQVSVASNHLDNIQDRIQFTQKKISSILSSIEKTFDNLGGRCYMAHNVASAKCRSWVQTGSVEETLLKGL